MNDLGHLFIEGGLAFLGSIFIYFLHRKDEQQQKQFTDFKESIHSTIMDTKINITDLYSKHSDDSDRLHSLELDVAKNFFSKEEINREFSNHKNYFDERFDRIERLLEDRRTEERRK